MDRSAAQPSSGSRVLEKQTEERLSDSSICEPSDEEISTKKEKHLRLGPDDLNETLLFEVGSAPSGKV